AGEVVGGGGGEVQGVHAAADGAAAARRVQAGVHRRLGLGPAVDHRHDHAHRPVVEDALDVVVAVGGHAGQRHAAGVGDGGQHVRGRLDADEAVFGVHRQPGEAGAGEEAAGGHAAQR